MNENKVPTEFIINALQNQIQDYSMRLANCMAVNEQLYKENEKLKKERDTEKSALKQESE